MPLRAVKDFSYRLDHSENMVVNTNHSYVKGIVSMLFGMRPGTDPFNPEMGLDLPGKRFTSARNGTRDTEYENEISKQFSTYTDMVVLNPIVIQKNGRMLVSFTLAHQSGFYDIQTGVADNTLTVAINSRNTGVKP